MKSRIFFKLIFDFALVIAAATLTLDVAITHAWENSLRNQIESDLRQKTAMFALRVSAAPLVADDLKKVAQGIAEASGARATVIDSQGQVLADSGAAPEKMENHARRPEFQAALGGQTGTDIRHSQTLGVDFLYVARPVAGGAVRLAVPLSAIAEANQKVRRSLLLASALACLIAILLAGWASRSLSVRLERILAFAGKIAEGDFSARLDEDQKDEIGRVASALDATARTLQTSFQRWKTAAANWKRC